MRACLNQVWTCVDGVVGEERGEILHYSCTVVPQKDRQIQGFMALLLFLLLYLALKMYIKLQLLYLYQPLAMLLLMLRSVSFDVILSACVIHLL